MITLESAREIAARHIRSSGGDAILLKEPIASGEYGWVFGYQSAAFLKTRKIGHALVGNAPVLVEKGSGSVVRLGTAYALEKYLEAYRRFGDPHAEAGPMVELMGWREGAAKVDAVKVIRTHSQLGLKEAKKVVEDCLAGQSPSVLCSDIETAGALVSELDAIGFEVRQLAKSG